MTGGRPSKASQGEQALTMAQRHARHAAKTEPGGTAYASALINDYAAFAAELLELAALPGGKAEQQLKDLAERVEARRRYLIDTLKKPHLADPT